MIQHINNKNKLFELLENGATVITPNNRLCESILEGYLQSQQRHTIVKPKCYSYDTFLIKSYEQLQFTEEQHLFPILLNSTQVETLWLQVLQQEMDSITDTLLQSIISAWEQCVLWKVDNDPALFDYTPQTTQFQKWWLKFDKILHTQNLTTLCQLVSLLIEAKFFPNGPVFWVCFDDFTPQQIALQDYYNSHKIEQLQFELPEVLHRPFFYKAPDKQQELQQVINWIKTKKSDQSVAVVVPNLQQEINLIYRTFDQNFAQEEFDLFLGKKLIDFPLVAHAIIFLQLNTAQINSHIAQLLLQSPYLKDSNREFILRSEYLQQSKLLTKEDFSFSRFVDDLQNSVPMLYDILHKLENFPASGTVSQWIERFQQRLTSLGFPGDNSLNSQSYQIYNRFKLAFDDFRELALFYNRISQQEAIQFFVRLLNSITFQPEKKQARIQILGLLEASGCEFDNIWVMNLSDQCLPQKVQLSAFIPVRLQKKLMMPHSTHDREFKFAQQILARLKNGAVNVVFSYPELSEENINLPCPLIKEVEIYQDLVSEPFSNKPLITQEDIYFHPLNQQTISGGTAILANQAKCPFKAFASHRLCAKPMADIAIGTSALDRGQIMHRIMELLWLELKSQTQLFQIDPEELEHLIKKSIDSALLTYRKYPSNNERIDDEIEHLRLNQLVKLALEWEKNRPSFHIVHLERAFSFNLAGLDFQIRVDRIDLVDEQKWVIDYKTSLPSARPWNEDRPIEPQLLLYALLDDEIAALMFLQVKAGNILCSGISEDKHSIIGLSTIKKDENWTGKKKKWHSQLEELAQEFKAGISVPQPQSASICEYCDFQNLCRYD